MKETLIAQIRLVLEPEPASSQGMGPAWRIVAASHDASQMPAEISGYTVELGKWAGGFDPGNEGLILAHKGRWSIVALGAANRVELVALKKADFARYFAADPFRVARKLKRGPAFCSPGEVSWAVNPEWAVLPKVSYFQDLLKSADSALLLGGAQALMDGAGVRLDAGHEDREVAERLWNLAPLSVRLERTMVIGDPGNILRADLTALSPTTQAQADFWNSQRLGDYPEGKYELALQSAIDQGDELSIERHLHRQSPRQVMLTAAFLLVGMIVIGILMSW